MAEVFQRKTRQYKRQPRVTISTTEGIDHDLERFIYKVFEEFEKSQGPRFSVFTTEWHKLNFGLIFCGRESFRDMFEFTEELFHRTKKYASAQVNGKPNHNLVRYACLYLMYSLYFKQPCRPRVKFRVKKEEFAELLELKELAKKDNHWDVMFAWSKLFTSNALHYVAISNPMGIEVAYQAEVRENADKGAAAASQDYFGSKEFESLMNKVSKAHTKYVTMKQSLADKNNKSDASLFFIDEEFPKTIQQLGSEIDKKEKAKKAREENKIGQSRRRLKDKFFSLGNSEQNYEEPK